LERTWATLAAVRHVVGTTPGLNDSNVGRNSDLAYCLDGLFGVLCKRSLKVDAGQCFAGLEAALRVAGSGMPYADYVVLEPAMEALARIRSEVAPGEPESALLRQVRKVLEGYGYGARPRECRQLIDENLAGGKEGPGDQPELLWAKEAWAARVNESIAALPDPRRRGALGILKHAGTASESAKPAKAWFAEAARRVEAMGPEAAGEAVASWLRSFAGDERAALTELEERYHRRPADPRAADRAHYRTNSGYVTGVAYLARCVGPAALPVLCDVVEHVARSKHHAREYSLPAATAALRSIEATDGDDAAVAAALSRLSLRLRWPKLRKAAEKALNDFVARKGISRDDAEEGSVPDFGLRDGAVTVPVGDGSAEIKTGAGDRPRVTWSRPGKPPTNVVPKALKQAHPEAVAAVSQTVDEIEKTLVAQRTRIDLLFRREVNWPYAVWRARYLDHGLLGGFTRRLIWQVDGTPGVFADGAWRDVRGEPIRFGEAATIALWHPASRPADEVLAWRQALEALQITQPLKQAHREVYLLTDAERRTRTYSNRFAAHVVRNHTTLAVSQVRKWKMGMYGGASSPSVALPHFGLRAEWWCEPAGEDHDRMGFPLYLVSDQVRFYRDGEPEPMPLEEVPPLALTEVMRDVDLFVGVASVGNDPAWQDGGPAGRYRDYWQHYSFGELSATARTRRAVLENLLPRLTKLNGRASLAERFLVVRGDLRTYKIHLGSGNIQMEPNSQYLCIVPDRSPAAGANGDGLFLPFEGDSTLSVILSKAFMLADDKAITDATITRQIHR
jgi:hypothetical protein